MSVFTPELRPLSNALTLTLRLRQAGRPSVSGGGWPAGQGLADMANKYAQLQDLIDYGQIKAAAAAAETNQIQLALDWAEGEFEALAGSEFNTQTVTLETPARAFVDKFGWLHLYAHTVGPVTSVQLINLRRRADRNWQALAWDAINDIILPPQDIPVDPDAWHVSVYPSTGLTQTAADNLLVRWTYMGGYATPPPPLKFLILRLAWWKYKLREAPLGRVSSPPFGITEIIPALPADIAQDVMKWTRLNTG